MYGVGTYSGTARLRLPNAQQAERFKRCIMGKINSLLPFRRSTRVNIWCPVKISGLLSNHTPFTEDAQIVTLSKFGAKVKTHTPLQVGMQVKVQPLRGRK